MREYYHMNGKYQEVAKARSKAWREKYYGMYVKRRYGIQESTYEALLAEQDGKCAICLEGPQGHKYHRRLCIDHNHSTGQVRGLLCTRCNRTLGLFKDRPELLERARLYLTKMAF